MEGDFPGRRPRIRWDYYSNGNYVIHLGVGCSESRGAGACLQPPTERERERERER